MAKILNQKENGVCSIIEDYLLGRQLNVSGRTIVDDQGAMILADNAELNSNDAVMLATEVRAKWGLTNATNAFSKATACITYVCIRIWRINII